MKLTYAQRKRIKSLATRYLRAYDGLAESHEINELNNSEFISFTENMLVDLCGFKKPETEKPEIYGNRKPGQRPPRRKPGERPPKPGEAFNKNSSELVNSDGKTKEPTIKPAKSDKPPWYKKAWRGVMLAVHPDRVDIVSADDIDKLERLQIGTRLRQDDSEDLLVACCNALEIDVDLNVFEQERILRVHLHRMKQEIKKIQQSVQWLWGESIVDNSVRAEIIKNVLQNSGIQPPDDLTIMEYLIKNSAY